MSKARDLASGAPAPAGVTSTEIGYVDGVTSAIQTQLNAKQAVVSGVNDTEIGYLDGVTSAIQTQIDSKLATTTASSTYIPNSTVTTKGDILVATGSGTIVRQGVGSNGQLLAANSAQADGVEWVNPPASGSMTLLGSVAASGTTFGISGISQSYRHLQIRFNNIGISNAGNPQPSLLLNGINGSNCYNLSTGGASSGAAMWTFAVGNSNSSRISGIINIYNYSDSTVNVKVFDSTSGYFAGASGAGAFHRGGAVVGTTGNSNNGVGAITSFSITDPNGYSYNTGTFELYGIN